MKYLFTLIFITITAINCKSQEKEKDTVRTNRIVICADFGIASPQGIFADKSSRDNPGGNANSGTHTDLFFAFWVDKQIGFAINGFYNRNPSEFPQELEDQFPDAKTKSATPWQTLGAMGGIYVQIPLDRSSVSFYGMVGMVQAKSPAVDITGATFDYYNGSFPYTYNLESGTASDIGFNFGANAQFSFSKLIFLNAGFDYLITKSGFNDVKSNFNGMEQAPLIFSQSINILSVTLGLGFKF